MSEPRTLIVNADDFGLGDAVNAGFAAAHERGIVSSATLMVNRPAAPAAAAYAAARPALAVGLHLDLGHWEYEDGEWVAGYEVCDLNDPGAVVAAARAQVASFRDLLGRDPTHVDSHQHVHGGEPAASAIRALAAELAVPLRGHGIRYEGGFYGQSGRGEQYPEGVSAQRLVELIESLPAGVTELGCHPGLGVSAAESSYAAERALEVEALCDPRVRAAIEAGDVALRSFADLG